MSGETSTYEAGVQAFKQGRYDDAIRNLKDFIQRCQQSGQTDSKLYVQAQMGLAKCYHAAHQPQAAIALCRHLANSTHPTLKPWAIQTLSNLKAQAQAHNGANATPTPAAASPTPSPAPAPEPEAAPAPAPEPEPTPMPTASLNESSEPTPEDPKLLEDGIQAHRKGKYEDAIASLTEYLRCQPSETSRNFMQAQMSLIKSYMALDQNEEAIARCKALRDTKNFALSSWIGKTLSKLVPPEELAPPSAAEPEPEPEPHAESAVARGTGARPSRSSIRVNARPTSSCTTSRSTQSGKFSSQEVLPLIGALVAIVVLGWLASGSVAFMGWFGIVLFLAAIGAGAAGTAGNSGLRMICLIVVVAMYIIAPFGLVVIWVDLLGIAIGVIGMGSILSVMRRSEASSPFEPKPMRMVIAVSLGLLLSLSGPLVFGGASGGQAMGGGRVLSDHVASGTATRDGQTIEFKGAGAFWDAAHKELRISLLPVPVTTADIDALEELVQMESGADSRSSNDTPARYITEFRESHDPDQFPDMPAAQLDIKFAPEATTFTTETVQVYNLAIVWPLNESMTTFSGVMCYFLPCRNPKDGLTILTFEPEDEGTLSLMVKPLSMGEPDFAFDTEPMQIDIQVRTKVSLLAP